MCLGIPMQVVQLNGQTALCERDGVRRSVALQLIDLTTINVGDYLIVHLGFAIEKINANDAKTAQETWQEWTDFKAERNRQTS